VKVFDARTGEEVGIIGRQDWNIWCMAFSPDRRRLATASNDGMVKVWAWNPAQLGQPQKPEFTLLLRVVGYGEQMAFTPDGQWLVTGSEGNAVKIWNARTGEELQAFHDHTGDVFALAIDREGRWLATAGEDTTIRIWDARSWKPMRTLRGHTGMIVSLAFSPDGRRLASGSRDHTVKYWDTARWKDASVR
jgi:WD40 repeat protein